jgi:hypothetical protein
VGEPLSEGQGNDTVHKALLLGGTAGGGGEIRLCVLKQVRACGGSVGAGHESAWSVCRGWVECAGDMALTPVNLRRAVFVLPKNEVLIPYKGASAYTETPLCASGDLRQ